VATLLLMRHWFFAQTYLQVGLQIVIGLVPYAIGVAMSIQRILDIDGTSAEKELKLVETTFFEAPAEKP